VQEEYSVHKQGPFEHIMDYKRRLDARLDALTASSSTSPLPADVSMDFLYGLENTPYAEFKAEVVNDMQKGTSAKLDDFEQELHVFAIHPIPQRITHLQKKRKIN
jgi:hypothetical protein